MLEGQCKPVGGEKQWCDWGRGELRGLMAKGKGKGKRKGERKGVQTGGGAGPQGETERGASQQGHLTGRSSK